MEPRSREEGTLRTALAECLDEHPVGLAVLFGSRGDGTATPLSDVDVAVRFEDDISPEEARRETVRIAADVERATAVEGVDVVDLDTAPPAIGYAALAEGTLLIGDPGEATELEARFLVRKLDFQPVKREWDAALSERIREGDFGRP